MATLNSSVGDGEWETPWDAHILMQEQSQLSSPQWVPCPGTGCDMGHQCWGCHGTAVAVARPRQATPTLLFPSSLFHNAESN